MKTVEKVFEALKNEGLVPAEFSCNGKLWHLV